MAGNHPWTRGEVEFIVKSVKRISDKLAWIRIARGLGRTVKACKNRYEDYFMELLEYEYPDITIRPKPYAWTPGIWTQEAVDKLNRKGNKCKMWLYVATALKMDDPMECKAKWEWERWKAYWIPRFLAVSAGIHPRLGANSFLRIMPADLVRNICSYV